MEEDVREEQEGGHQEDAGELGSPLGREVPVEGLQAEADERPADAKAREGALRGPGGETRRAV